MIAVAALAVGGTWVLLLVSVRGLGRRRPLGIDALLAWSLLIAFETLVANGLSSVHALTSRGLLAAHVLGVFMLVALTWRRLPAALEGMARAARAQPLPALGVAAPIVFLAAVSALRFAPNNWDSMTYHLARVVHWITEGSVAAVPTPDARENILMPGAEYVLLALLGISSSDRLAALVQLGCFVSLVVSAYPLARTAGAPRRAARWAPVLMASLPMGVLQASSTQNDLVAAAAACAAVGAVTPYLHGGRSVRYRFSDAALLGVVLGSAAVVKATAVLAVVPLFVLAAIATIRNASLRRAWRGMFGPAFAATTVALVLVAPDALRRAMETPPSFASSYLFPLGGEWIARLANAFQGAAHHAVAPQEWLTGWAPASGAQACTAGVLCVPGFVRFHEDLVGNPFHALLCVTLIVIAVARWRYLPPRARFAVALAPVTWLAFHFVLRDNLWFSRLQTPLFALFVPASLAALSFRGRESRTWTALVTIASVAATAAGIWIAWGNETRPPFARSDDDRLHARYYWNHPVGPWLFRAHDLTLQVAAQTGCSRLGLYLRGDSFEYPLSWRALQQGVSSRHVTEPDGWACLVFSEMGEPPSVPGAGWAAVVKPILWRPAAR